MLHPQLAKRSSNASVWPYMARASGTMALHSTGIAKASDAYEMEWRYQHNRRWRSLVGLHPSFSALANGAPQPIANPNAFAYAPHKPLAKLVITSIHEKTPLALISFRTSFFSALQLLTHTYQHFKQPLTHNASSVHPGIACYFHSLGGHSNASKCEQYYPSGRSSHKDVH